MLTPSSPDSANTSAAAPGRSGIEYEFLTDLQQRRLYLANSYVPVVLVLVDAKDLVDQTKTQHLACR